MPIADIEIVVKDKAAERKAVAGELADGLGLVFGTSPGHTWVKIRYFEPGDYGENGITSEELPSPVFVKLVKAEKPTGTDLADEMLRVARCVAGILDRPVENIHVLYEPDGRGRIGFGGKLVI